MRTNKNYAARWDVVYDSGKTITDVSPYWLECDPLVEDELPKVPTTEAADLARITAVAEVRAWGRSKHTANDWLTVTYRDHFASLFRHLMAAGPDFKGRDAESGFYHLAHALCRLEFIVGKLVSGVEK